MFYSLHISCHIATNKPIQCQVIHHHANNMNDLAVYCNNYYPPLI